MRRSRKKTKPAKESFAVRMKRRGREFKSLGETLAKEPKSFPHALLDVFRRSFRTVWDARGGGLFAVGYVITFVWLEIKMLAGDIMEAESISGFFGAQLFEMFFRYLGESFMNMIYALMWPVYFVSFVPPFGAIAFGLAYMGFDKLFRDPIEAWLFDDEDSPEEPNPATSNGQKEG